MEKTSKVQIRERNEGWEIPGEIIAEIDFVNPKVNQ